VGRDDRRDKSDSSIGPRKLSIPNFGKGHGVPARCGGFVDLAWIDVRGTAVSLATIRRGLPGFTGAGSTCGSNYRSNQVLHQTAGC
jgi:hypothetical protein